MIFKLLYESNCCKVVLQLNAWRLCFCHFPSVIYQLKTRSWLPSFVPSCIAHVWQRGRCPWDSNQGCVASIQARSGRDWGWNYVKNKKKEKRQRWNILRKIRHQDNGLQLYVRPLPKDPRGPGIPTKATILQYRTTKKYSRKTLY